MKDTPTPEQVEYACRAWFAAVQRIWASRNAGEPFPHGGYDDLAPNSRRLFNKAMESALKASTPSNIKKVRERQLRNS
ncbi:MAG: hypothetical protein JJ979_02640 [Roseibium sp.]|nr:hypothetical protein [Roseibium sp.]